MGTLHHKIIYVIMFLNKTTNSTEDCFLKILLLFLIVFTFNNVQAQEIHSVSLSEALKLAKENNKKILRSQLETTLSEQNIKERKELRLPDIELNGE